MARFNSEMYEKVYPRQEPVEVEPVETAVETFTPTKDIDTSVVEGSSKATVSAVEGDAAITNGGQGDVNGTVSNTDFE